MGVEYNQPAHLLDRYIKGGDINGGRLYPTTTTISLVNQTESLATYTTIACF